MCSVLPTLFVAIILSAISVQNFTKLPTIAD